jgi:hypothetical protein
LSRKNIEDAFRKGDFQEKPRLIYPRGDIASLYAVLLEGNWIQNKKIQPLLGDQEAARSVQERRKSGWTRNRSAGGFTLLARLWTFCRLLTGVLSWLDPFRIFHYTG